MKIDIAGALAQVGVQIIVDQGFQGVAERCSKVTRDPVTNRVTMVDNAFVNQDSACVVGTDLEVGYTHQLSGSGTRSTSTTSKVSRSTTTPSTRVTTRTLA